MPILVWNYGHRFHISNPEHLTGIVAVVNLTGQVMIQTDLTGESDQTLSHTLTDGIYVAQIRA